MTIDVLARNELFRLGRAYRAQALDQKHHKKHHQSALLGYQATVFCLVASGESPAEAGRLMCADTIEAYHSDIMSAVDRARSVIMEARDLRKHLPIDEDNCK